MIGGRCIGRDSRINGGRRRGQAVVSPSRSDVIDELRIDAYKIVRLYVAGALTIAGNLYIVVCVVVQDVVGKIVIMRACSFLLKLRGARAMNYRAVPIAENRIVDN